MMKKKSAHKPKHENTVEDEYKNKYLRALADYQNLEKRVAGQKLKVRQDLIEEIVLKLLPVIDDLEKARLHLKNDGINIIVDNFDKILQGLDVMKINPGGQDFDPEIMECVQVIAGKEDKILDVVRPGYMINGKIIRPAQVTVSKKSNQ